VTAATFNGKKQRKMYEYGGSQAVPAGPPSQCRQVKARRWKMEKSKASRSVAKTEAKHGLNEVNRKFEF
jgi:hypothetical protein